MSLETVNICKAFEKKHKMHYYDSLTPADRIKAWGSFTTWIKNPIAHMDTSLISRVFSDLIKSEYFCPLSDKDIVMEMLKPALARNTDECFIMLRLSQNTRPLVWVCAFGGSSKIFRIRIGVTTVMTSTTSLVTNYTVILDGQLAYQDTSLKALTTKLYIHYGNGRTAYAWPRLMNRVTVRPSDYSSVKDQTMVLV